MTRPPFATLTNHFVGVILSPPILTELGGDYLRRTLSSLVGMLLLAGVFLPSAFFKRYVDLNAEIRPTNFEPTLRADTVLMIAVPMLIAGLIAVVIAPMMFPDETDYQVLTPLPVTHGHIFAARLCALAAIVAVGVVAINTITSIWFPFVSGGRRAHYPLGLRVVAHAIAATSGTVWVVSAVMALQGLTLLLSPAGWRRRVSFITQGGVLLGLLLSLPLVASLPAADMSRASIQTSPLVWVPPVWFFNFEQWLLTGAEAERHAARAALWASLATGFVIAVSYMRLYRSAERLAGFSGAARARQSSGIGILGWAERKRLLPQATAAVVAFSILGMLRSRLHQIVLILIIGVGLALLIGQLLTVTGMTTPVSSGPRAVVDAALAAPLLVALAITFALRAAFLLPLDRDATWIVRLTETPAERAPALDGVAHVLRCAAVVPAVTVAVILQSWALGGRWPLAVGLTIVAVLVLVEVVLADWARIPFTCSYLPGKRVMAYTLGVLFAAYAVFVYLGANSIRWSLVHPSRTLVVGGLLVATFAVLRRARLRAWGLQPLEFEDEDPTTPRSLGLLPDEH